MRRMLRYIAVASVLRPLQAAAEAAAEPAHADAAPDATVYSLVVPLLAVVFALAALWWMLRRNGGRIGAAGPLRIAQVLAVGPRERIVVVEVESQRFMVGVTQSSIAMLANLGPKDAAKILPIASAASDCDDTATNG